MCICFALNCRHADVCRNAHLFVTTRPIHSSFSVALDGIKGTVHFWRHGNCADTVIHLFTLCNRLEAGRVILKAGHPAGGLYFVLSGTGMFFIHTIGHSMS